MTSLTGAWTCPICEEHRTKGHPEHYDTEKGVITHARQAHPLIWREYYPPRRVLSINLDEPMIEWLNIKALSGISRSGIIRRIIAREMDREENEK